MRGSVGILFLAAALAGCAAAPGAPSRPGGLGAVVGLSKAALLSCAGVPVREIATGNEERLVYTRTPVDERTTTGGLVIGGDSSGIGFGLGVTVPLRSSVRGCEATATLHDGRVSALTLSTQSDPNVCAPLFANCGAP